MTEYTFDKLGRLNFHPDLHANQGKPWTNYDQNYLADNYYIDGPECVSLALERTIRSIMVKANELRKIGLMSAPTKRKNHKRVFRTNLLNKDDCNNG
ncbi:hypothetical protein ACOI22_03605 [Glaciecola sp. 2405UD65-10]|uniref:hypothetical protein n=1 Tax=Glaciecola sp. 2405UD65-10 TaxID=3397244 RepID=UPI003B5C1B16